MKIVGPIIVWCGFLAVVYGMYRLIRRKADIDEAERRDVRARLGDADGTLRVYGPMDFLGGHPAAANPIDRCCIGTLGDRCALVSSNEQLLYVSFALSDIVDVQIGSGEHARSVYEHGSIANAILPASMATTGASAILTLITNRGPMTFEQKNTTQAGLMKELAPFLASLRSQA